MRPSGLEGKLAFVTGAGGGIGEAVVRALAAEGARVIASDRTTARIEALREELGDAIMPVDVDVADTTSVDLTIAQIENSVGPIDYGVNVAGILSAQTVMNLTDAEWQRTFDVNVGGVFRVSRALVRFMQPRGRGAIVTVASNAAGVPRHSMSAYAASKAAATMFTRCLGLEMAPYGIRCNIVAPGSTLTTMQTGMWADENGAANVIAGSLENFKAGIPLGKLATPEDVAETVLFLLSDRAGHITMTDLYVDGGATLRA